MRLFVLLEDACHHLDLKAHMEGIEDSGPSYKRYATALQQLTERKDEQLGLRNALKQLEQVVTHSLATGVLTASHPLLLQALKDIQGTKTRLDQLVSITVFRRVLVVLPIISLSKQK